MSNRVLAVSEKSVDNVLVATLRFRGTPRDIPYHFAKLYDVARPWICGQAICLYHDDGGKEERDLEVCFQVSQNVRTGHVKSRILPGGRMLCTVHPGSYYERTGPCSLEETWRRFRVHIGDSGLKLTSGPVREVYKFNGNGGVEDGYLAELQVPFDMPNIDSSER